MLINKEKKVAKKIKEMLNKRGFIVDMQVSKRTKSIYLKVDNGASGRIRISDHKNKLTRSKFNVIENYKGKRSEYSNNIFKKYYNFNNLAALITDIEIERSNFIIMYGYTNYKMIRDKKQKLRSGYDHEKKVA